MKLNRKECDMNALFRHTLRMGFAVLLLTLTLAAWSAVPAVADDEVEAAPPTVSVTLDKKTPEVVITNAGDRYTVSKQETIIVGLDGRQVDYIDLSVPCDAQVVYHPDDGGNQADLITVVRVSSNATKNFFHERPE